MGGSKAVIGAEKAILKDDIIKTVEQRYQRVKAEKARMIQEWKNNLTDLTSDAKEKVETYEGIITELQFEINSGINVEENEKKIAELEEKIDKLEEKEIHGCRFKASRKGNYERYYGKRRRKFLSLLWRKFRQLGRSEATFM